MSNLMQSALNCIAKKFREDTSKMLIWTGVIGWGLSSFAQALGVLFNPKLPNKQKSFLIPQEFADAGANIGLFFAITLLTKITAGKLYKTGKLAPQSVRKFLNENKALYGNKVGKFDFNLDTIAETSKMFPKEAYETYKNVGTTLATVCAGIAATNVMTPVIRNVSASRRQKKYIDYVNNNPYPTTYSSGMKI